jgi:CheY-like chemotaxis protein
LTFSEKYYKIVTMIVILIIGILVTASFVAGAFLDFPLTDDIAFWSLAALTVLLTVSFFVAHRRKGKLITAREEKTSESEQRGQLEEKLRETEKKLEETRRAALLDGKTAKKFLTLVSMLLRVSPADAHTLLLRTIRFFTAKPYLDDDAETVFSTETLIADSFAAAFCDNNTAGMKIFINIPDSFPVKLRGPEELVRTVIAETAQTVVSLPPAAVNIDIDFTDRGEVLDVRFIFEAAGLPISKNEADILTGAVSRGGAGGSLYSAKTIAETLGGSFDIKRRGEGTLFTVILPLSRGGGGIIGNSAARNIASLQFLQCDFDYMPYGRVLICDKNPRSRIAYADLLLLHGLKTYTAADTESAVKLIRAGENFGVIFFDFDGENDCSALRECGFDGTVIALSENDISKDGLQSAGFDGHIKKPCDFRIIESVLRQFIVSRQPPAVIAAATYTRTKTLKSQMPPETAPIAAPDKNAEPTFEETLSALANLPSVDEAALPDQTAQTETVQTPQAEAVPAAQPVPSQPATPRITTNAQGISKTEFIALADEIFIKLYETMDSDLKEFAAQAKLIKNACADLGNTDLTAKARALEFAAKDGKTAFIGEFTPEFLSDLKRYADSLSASPQPASLVSAAVKILAETPGIKNTPPILPAAPASESMPSAQLEPRAETMQNREDSAPSVQREPTAETLQNREDSVPSAQREPTAETAPNREIAAPPFIPAENPQEVPPQTRQNSANAALESVVSACGDFDSARALEAVSLIDTDKLDAMSYGLIEEIKSLISIGELDEAAEMAGNLLEDLAV